ncbi:hypothetical protein EB796_012909 [Bugula neritina]|uniref:Uncharacterized protein n=1 Tax=Bugula neritina TaxID=10212 RepID=A0A7J7JSA2_BUGNE|nr:hypothetical protein EB796_012909 [Bugula neritina]
MICQRKGAHGTVCQCGNLLLQDNDTGICLTPKSGFSKVAVIWRPGYTVAVVGGATAVLAMVGLVIVIHHRQYTRGGKNKLFLQGNIDTALQLQRELSYIEKQKLQDKKLLEQAELRRLAALEAEQTLNTTLQEVGKEKGPKVKIKITKKTFSNGSHTSAAVTNQHTNHQTSVPEAEDPDLLLFQKLQNMSPTGKSQSKYSAINIMTSTKIVEPCDTELSMHAMQQSAVEEALNTNITIYLVMFSIPLLIIIIVLVGKYAKREIYRKNEQMTKNRMATLIGRTMIFHLIGHILKNNSPTDLKF